MSELVPLGRSFFARDADLVARGLVGARIVRGKRVAKIVETEAYFGPPGANPGLAARADLPRRLASRILRDGDPASHSFRGRTARNRVMWGPPGHAYVYLIYGMHECMNVTTGTDGEPQAVLLRAAEMERPGGADAGAACGPGKLTRALGITRADYGCDLTRPPLFLAEGEDPRRVAASPRVNVTGAKDYRLRFYDPASPAVSRFSQVTRTRSKARAAR